MDVIPIVLSGAAICVSLYLGFHREHKEDTEADAKESKDLSVAFATMDVKQDSILQAVNEMRVEQRTQNQKIADIEKHMIILDQSTKSAHHRLDDLINQANTKKSERND